MPPHADGNGHRQHRQAKDREVDGVAIGNHRQHTAHGARYLLFEIADGMTDQLGHAEGQHREIGPTQMQHGRPHHHRDHRGKAGTQGNGSPPAQRLQHQRTGVGANAEERGRRQRQVARTAAEQRPARRQRDIHQAGQHHRDDEFAAVVRQGHGPSSQAEQDQQIANEPLSVVHLAKSPFGRNSNTAMNTLYDNKALSEGLVKCMPSASMTPSNNPPASAPLMLPKPPSVMTISAVTV
ncbi:MAG: hypothetical protein BWX79_03239 [Alphaproteobacteria bacterium ADurb.Bin100]|nr:MAG: hypothetical protein BWX79_03239 [Alphaproteobacteria bacterium ADurb.Bin100]